MTARMKMKRIDLIDYKDEVDYEDEKSSSTDNDEMSIQAEDPEI